MQLLLLLLLLVAAAAAAATVVVVVECESGDDRMVGNALRQRAQKFGFWIVLLA